MYHQLRVEKGQLAHHFRFFAGTENQFSQHERTEPHEQTPDCLVSIQELPTHLQALLAQTQRTTDGLQRIGFIQIPVENNLATTRDISPKAYLIRSILDTHSPAPGLGTELEILAVTHLKTKGITHVKTGPAPSKERQKVLALADLPLHTAVPIDKWLAGLRLAHSKILDIVARREAEQPKSAVGMRTRLARAIHPSRWRV